MTVTFVTVAAVSTACGVLASTPSLLPTTSPLLVSLGESTTAGEGVAESYTSIMAHDLGMRSLNLASGGVTIDLAIDRELPLIPHDCSIVTILSGTNDVYPLTRQILPPTQLVDALRTLVAGARAACPAARIFVGTIWLDHRPRAFDAGIAAVNDAIRGLRDVTVVDLFADSRVHDVAYQVLDGTHPNEAGHLLIARAFEAAIAATKPRAMPLVSSLPAVFLTPLTPTRAISVSGAILPIRLEACVDRQGHTIAHQLGAAMNAVVTLAMDAPGHCTLVANDGAGGAVTIPVAAYGPLTVDHATLTMHLGGESDIKIAEAGYYNDFGIASVCANSAGDSIVHWSKPSIAGPSSVQTIVPDRVGACNMRVFDFNVPAQVVDIPIAVLP